MSVSMLHHPLAHVEVLLAVTFWPVLAAVLLLLTPPVRQATSAVTFAVAGALMTPLAVAFLPGTDGFAAVLSCAVACIPLLLPQGRARAECVLPFLVTGCALMALNLHSALVITVACGAGIVLLAWREAKAGRRATFVWEMSRARLCGVVLAALGSMVLPMAQHAALGAVLLAVGLCMMAGLGPSPAPGPGAALMETGLRFAAIALMMRLDGEPLVRLLVMIAGFAGLGFAALGSATLKSVTSGSSVPGFRAFGAGEIVFRERRPAVSLLPALAVIGAAAGEPGAVVLLLVAALGATTLEARGVGEDAGVPFRGAAPWPVFGALVLLGRTLEPWALVLLIVCVASGLRGIGESGAGLFDRWRDGFAVKGVTVALVLAGLAGPFLLWWHPVIGWRP